MSQWGPYRRKADAARAAHQERELRQETGGEETPDLMDQERAAVIRALDPAAIDFSEWEADFIGGMYQRVEQGKPFTDKMRAQIDRLGRKYSREIPSARRAAPVRSQTREATGRDPLFDKH